ncbi:MAG: alpha/beta fold hydrolase [Rhodothalassiaceae bacterium]
MFDQRYYHSQDGLRLAFRDYSADKDGLPLLCLHGLTRNSADFEEFAEIFMAERRVLALDVRGRGLSEYDPKIERYQIPTYVNDVVTLLDELSLDRVVPVGTSMGGLISFMLATLAPDRIAGAIINDIGMEISPAGLKRIQGYVGKTAPIHSWDRAVATLKLINERFFPDFTEADWQRWARRLIVEEADGSLHFAYDPNIAEAMAQSGAAPADLWPLMDAMKPIPMLLIRGVLSDILSAETVARMTEIKPDLIAVEVPNRGHAPVLNEPVAVEAIGAFLKTLP